MAIFAIEVSRFTDFAGLTLTTDSLTHSVAKSRKGKHQYRYTLKAEGAVIGVLCYQTNNHFTQSTENILNNLHEILVYPLRNALQYLDVLQQALSDSLTGLANRREFDNQIKRAVNQASRRRSKIAVILLDLDKFKLINDTFGHQVGDSVLSQFARALKNSVRDSDSVFRLGGDEFAILVEDACYKAMKAIEIRLFHFINMDPLLSKYNVQFSAGSSMLSDDDDIESLMERADKKLYQDKIGEPTVVDFR